MGAAADRVVGRVVDHPPPSQLEEPLRPLAAMQRGQRLGIPFEQALDPAAGGLEIDSSRADAHQHVRPGAGAELACPMTGRSVVRIRAGRIVGQGLEAHLDLRVVAVDSVHEVGETR